MGNSEVGHMNLGAGRVIYQELKFNKAVKDKELNEHPVLKSAFNYALNSAKMSISLDFYPMEVFILILII